MSELSTALAARQTTKMTPIAGGKKGYRVVFMRDGQQQYSMVLKTLSMAHKHRGQWNSGASQGQMAQMMKEGLL